MGVSIGSEYYLNNMFNSASSSKASALESSIGALNAAEVSDEELLDACKSFESYLVEQMLKGMEKTIPKDDEDEENDYVAQFGDMLYENVADSIAQNGELGVANQLYEAMKRNQGL